MASTPMKGCNTKKVQLLQGYGETERDIAKSCLTAIHESPGIVDATMQDQDMLITNVGLPVYLVDVSTAEINCKELLQS